jgi:hypothetical protein
MSGSWHKGEDLGTAAIVSAAGGATDALRGYMFALTALWTAIVHRSAVKQLLHPPRINFDLEVTALELEQRG